MRVGDIISWGVDSDVGSGFVISDETTFGLDYESKVGYYDYSFAVLNDDKPVG